MDKSPSIIQILHHDEHLRHVVNRYKTLGLLVKHIGLWENVVFITSIIINFIIVASYS